MTSLAAEDAASTPQRDRRKMLAVAAILTCSVVWGLQFGMIRWAVTTSLTPTDITILRYVFGLPVMLPIMLMYGWRNGAGLGWGRMFVLTFLGGLPMLLLSNAGLQFAPANHAACLQPGTVAVVSTLFLLATGGARRSPLAPVGLTFAVLGLAGVALGVSRAEAAAAGPLMLVGDAMFILSGVSWALYTVLLMRWNASPLVTTAMNGLLSLAMVPLALTVLPSNLLNAPVGDIVMHGLFQGIVNYAFAFLLWAFAAKTLGPVRMGFFAPLIPVCGVLWGIPLLGEWLTPVQWLSVAGVVGGLSLIAWSQRARFS